MITLPRRAFITGLATIIAAPAVIRVTKLMTISVQPSQSLFNTFREPAWPPPSPYGRSPAMELLEQPIFMRFHNGTT